MEITKTQREQAELTASRTQLDLYESPEAGAALWGIATKFNLVESKNYYIFTKLVGDVVLGFYKQQDLLALIQNLLPILNQIQQLELELEIKKFLLPLSTPQTSQLKNTPVDLTNELAETEKEFASVQGLRTMAKDIQAVHPQHEQVYQSSQATILDRPVVPRPPATPLQPLDSRWDTGQ